MAWSSRAKGLGKIKAAHYRDIWTQLFIRRTFLLWFLRIVSLKDQQHDE